MSIAFGCQKNEEQVAQNTVNASGHQVTVAEVIQASAYTYLKVQEGDSDYWLAVTKRDAEKGEVLYYRDAMEMNNFASKDLDRTFDKIYFVQEISKQPPSDTNGMPTTSAHGKITSQENKSVSVEPASGGLTIAKLYAGKEQYANKTATIRGQVTKFNSGIMGRNWVHLQDGTKVDDNYDLTVTTNDVVKVGEVVTFTGQVVLNRDFGAGYAYDIILEEAKRQ
jgi:hypothetical protein